MNKRKKVSIIGAGKTGATLAFILAKNESADIVIVDRPQSESAVKGKALDIQESGPIFNFNIDIKGTADYSETKDSDIVVITAGIARKPGMSRDDLIQTNEEIVHYSAQQIAKYAPDAIIIVLTNPVDAMTYSALVASGFPKHRVLGQSGVLDSARYKTFIAKELGISVEDVQGLVLGGHGDTMVPLVNSTQVNGIPLSELLDQQVIDQIIDRTRKGGAEIVQLLGNGSAYYAPAAAIYEMIDAILKDKCRVLAAITYLEDEYGYRDICLGVPIKLGQNGVEEILELTLSQEEQNQLDTSALSVKNVKDALKYRFE
ncbi:malate dehydrogenase [Staphylococcus warneri]|uniref:malate dehydrogenase n=1 Tax=Staphylococcus TaxID=1279 RepID=UPI0009526621|nr:MULTISPECIES: malate dehydrogenase [Staphylococcus]OLS04545.1 malate dehydrogenase [Staphylococcus epidermidis]AXV43019.1 L-lactate dehydrogenase [Staphylococcus sp. M0911]MCD8804070.1 malate dehydrogenase [Staphylococcus warneri]MCD8805516.1 malate dehydrogenase [Staphylococcus warneri]PTI19336.1 malate dehydrogenase [Staphylococcus warneri]